MNESRHLILSDIRSALNNQSNHQERKKTVAARLKEKPPGIIPKRGQLKHEDRIVLFTQMATKVHANVVRLSNYQDVPRIISQYLREHNLPAMIRTGYDKRLCKANWSSKTNIQVRKGPSHGNDLVGISHAQAGIAETGSLLLVSGQDNPTTINFLADHHFIVVSAHDIKGSMEAAWDSLSLKDDNRKIPGPTLPRTVNIITGPSRSGDIEQKLLLGAHGPRTLQIIIVG